MAITEMNYVEGGGTPTPELHRNTNLAKSTTYTQDMQDGYYFIGVSNTSSVYAHGVVENGQHTALGSNAAFTVSYSNGTLSYSSGSYTGYLSNIYVTD